MKLISTIISFIIFPVIIIKSEMFLLQNNTIDNYWSIDREYFLGNLSEVFCTFDTKTFLTYYEDDVSANFIDRLLKFGSETCNRIYKVTKFSENNTTLPTLSPNGENFVIMLLARLKKNQAPNVSHLRMKTPQKHTDHHIVIYENSENINLIDVKKYLVLLFVDHKLLNAVALFWDANNDVLRSYTYSPFDQQLIELYPNVNDRNDDFESKLFYNKLRNINGHELRASLFEVLGRVIKTPQNEYYGPEIYIAHAIKKVMNASLKIVAPPDGGSFGSFRVSVNTTGALRQIIANEVDISFNLRFLDGNIYSEKLFEMVEVFEKNGICIMVPFTTLTNSQRLISKLYSDGTGMLLDVFSLLCILILFNFLMHAIRFPMHPSTWPDFFGYIYKQPAIVMPSLTSHRIMLMFWIYYCFINSVSKESNVISDLTVRKPAPKFKYLSDLLSSEVLIAVTEGLEKSIRDNSRKDLYTKYAHKFIKLRAADQYKMLKYPTNENKCLASTIERIQYLAKTNVLDGKYTYYNMEDGCIVPYWSSYIVPYGSIYVGRFNEIVNYANEAGLFKTWIDDLYTNYTIGIRLLEPHPKVIPLESLRDFFVEHAIGLSIAGIVFVGEMLTKGYYSEMLKGTVFYKFLMAKILKK